MSTEDIVRASRPDLAELRRSASSAPLKRSRLCAHRDLTDPLHEMLIVLSHDSYVRPHRHSGKTESFHVIEGSADLVVFDEDGGITDVLQLGDYASGRVFYYRLNVAVFHTVRVRSELLIVHETTNGPFDPADTCLAPWAPGDGEPAGCARYTSELDRRLASRDAT